MIVHDKCAAFEAEIDRINSERHEIRRRLLEAIEVLGMIAFHQSTKQSLEDYENIKQLAYDATVKLGEF